MAHWNKLITVKFNETELIDGKEVENAYVVQLDAKIVNESNYGADADGHRGVPMTWVDDYKVLLVQNSCLKEYDLSNLPDWIYDKINNAVEDVDITPEGPDNDIEDFI